MSTMDETATWLNVLKMEHAEPERFDVKALEDNESVVPLLTKGTTLNEDVEQFNDISIRMAQSALRAFSSAMLSAEEPMTVLPAIFRGMWLDGALFGAHHERRNAA